MIKIIYPSKDEIMNNMVKTIEFDKIVNKRLLQVIPPEKRIRLNVGDIVTITIVRIKSATKPRKNVEEIEPHATVKEDEYQNAVDDVEKLQPSGYRENVDSTTRFENPTKLLPLRTVKPTVR
jgi:hypothetical protein